MQYNLTKPEADRQREIAESKKTLWEFVMSVTILIGTLVGMVLIGYFASR